MLSEQEAMNWLVAASLYARNKSGCKKVSVGTVILNEKYRLISFGANKVYPYGTCETKGCLREEKYGNNSKEHRNPDDCRALHSEIDAIATAAEVGFSLQGTTMLVTRYPCEACARAIVSAGIKRVIYGRTQEISAMTQEIFNCANIEVIHVPEYTEEDVLT